MERPRRWVEPKHRLLPSANNCGYTYRFDSRWWCPPPFRLFYQQNNPLHFDTEKPLLVIHNKHNEEWGRPPANFFNLSAVSALIERFAQKYQIVYIRPCPHRITDPGYSWDHNADRPYNEDFEWLEQHPEYNVHTFESIQSTAGYNETKLWLFSKCENYISVQGGGSVLIPFFAKRLLVLHKEGPELYYGTYKPGSWFHSQCQTPEQEDSGMELRIVTEDHELIPTSVSLFLED